MLKVKGIEEGVRPSIRVLDPSPPSFNFVHDHLVFSKIIIIYCFINLGLG